MTKPNSALQAGGDETPVATDDFKGDTPHLILCIQALLDLDAKGALAPHGIGGHARTMLSAAAARLTRPTPAAAAGVPSEARKHLSTIITALSQMTAIPAKSFKGHPGAEFIDRERVMSLVMPIRDAAYALGKLASPVAPAGVPIDEQIYELAHRNAWRYKQSSDPHHSDTYTFNDSCLINFARAVLSAGAPAVPLLDEKDSDSSHLAAPGSTVPTALTVGTPVSWQPIETAPHNVRVLVQAPEEIAIGWLDRIDGRWYYSPQGGLLEWAPSEWMPLPPIQCDGRDGVTGSGPSSEAREATLASNGTNGHGKDCA